MSEQNSNVYQLGRTKKPAAVAKEDYQAFDFQAVMRENSEKLAKLKKDRQRSNRLVVRNLRPRT